MSIEDEVLDYWKARSERHDRELQELALDGIRAKVERVTSVIGFLWCDELDKLLISACLNYSRSSGQPFMIYFIRRMQSVFRLTYEQESKMLQAVNT